jgi:hypothetical protein
MLSAKSWRRTSMRLSLSITVLRIEQPRERQRVSRASLASHSRVMAERLRLSLPPSDPTLISSVLDGDGSDVPAFLSAVVTPLATDHADFVMGSRLRGWREPGSIFTSQQIVAVWLASLLLKMTYGVRFTDMSPFRGIRVSVLRSLGKNEKIYGWNLEMQMRVAAAGLRLLEIPVNHCCRQGGHAKVSGNLVAGLKVA